MITKYGAYGQKNLWVRENQQKEVSASSLQDNATWEKLIQA